MGGRDAVASMPFDRQVEIAKVNYTLAAPPPTQKTTWIPDTQSGILQVRHCTSNLNPSLNSFSEYPEKKRQHQRNDDAGSDRKVEAESFTLDINITWKMTDAQLGQPRPSHSNQDENDANNDEPLCHNRYLMTA